MAEDYGHFRKLMREAVGDYRPDDWRWSDSELGFTIKEMHQELVATERELAAARPVIEAARRVRADLKGDEAVRKEYDGHQFISPSAAPIRGSTLLELQAALDALDAARSGDES